MRIKVWTTIGLVGQLASSIAAFSSGNRIGNPKYHSIDLPNHEASPLFDVYKNKRPTFIGIKATSCCCGKEETDFNKDASSDAKGVHEGAEDVL